MSAPNFIIYALIAPPKYTEDNPLYVGKTKNLKRRFGEHLREAFGNGKVTNEYRVRVMRKLAASGIDTSAIILEVVDEDTWEERERYHIARFSTLTNLTIGGDGVVGMKEETKKKLSDFRRGSKMAQETKDKISRTTKGRRHTEEHKRKIWAANSGRILSEEALRNIRDARSKWTWTDEMRVALALRNKIRGASAETREKISKANKGRIVTAETRAKLSLAGRGRKMSEEQKSRLRAAWVTRKEKQCQNRI